MNSPKMPRILTIDDEADIRQSFCRYLSEFDYEVLEAASGRAGLDLFMAERPDLILVDLRMPDVDGLTVIAAVKKESPETPVIVVSGTGNINDAIEALRLGAWDYLLKPLADLAVLRHAVEKALERTRLLAENRAYQLHLEEEVTKRTAELRQAQKMEAIGTLAGGIAHDFNNILTPIFGYTDFALGHLDEPEQLKSDLENISQAARRARDLVRQILTISRKTGQEQQPLQISLIVKEVIKLLRASIPSTIVIRHNILSQRLVQADPSHIHQIVMNLCTNAYHAMRDKGGELAISLINLERGHDEVTPGGIIKRGSWVRLSVSDTGCGMARETMAHIFDPYFTTKEVGEGTGLGLAVVHGIVESHDGIINVESEAGRGTEFSIDFPVLETECKVNAVQDEMAEIRGGGECIMVVDDEEANAIMVKSMLSRFGYRVEAFTDSVAALVALAENPGRYDLLITDLTMPGLAGTQLIRKALALRSSQRIILYSGQNNFMPPEEQNKLGIMAFIPKPLTMRKLLQTVRQALDE
ncbi:MAG: response regulator [Deltaproteobacteria bacterium]|nr:response regulator [Deltaproteobacteria bacterium]